MTMNAAVEAGEQVGGVGDTLGLADLVRHWRERASLSQEQLADLAGMSERSVRRLERGISRRPRRSSLRLLAEALGLSTAEQTRLLAAADPRERSVPAGVAGTGTEASVGPAQLLPAASHFVGRDDELAALHDVLGSCQASESLLVLIVGGAGSGKTALANRWCSAVADAFPGGSLYLDLRGFDPRSPLEPADAVSALLRSLGVAPDQVPEDLSAASAMLRSRTAGRRTLMLLDNAVDARQVRPLLPTSGSAAIVTSRDQLRGLMVRDATARIALGPLAQPDSVALLDRISGRAGSDSDDDVVRELVERCGRVPLALRILGERLARQSRTPAELLAELDQDRSLEAFRSGDDLYSDLPTSLSWSFEQLDPATAQLLACVCRLEPGDEFGSEAAGVASGLPRAAARRHLDRLVCGHLVEQLGHDRYLVNRLVRLYAAVRTEGGTAPSAGGERVVPAVP